MNRLPPKYTRTDTLFPDPTLFRSPRRRRATRRRSALPAASHRVRRPAGRRRSASSSGPAASAPRSRRRRSGAGCRRQRHPPARAWSAPPGRAGRDGEKKSGSWLYGRGVPRMRRGSASPDGRLDAGAGDSLYTAREEAGGRIMADFPERTLDDWQALATKELKGRYPAGLVWKTPEGIAVKPLYTAADLQDLEHLDTMPGFAPFVPGPRATMYANRPWTIRQYAGF